MTPEEMHPKLAALVEEAGAIARCFVTHMDTGTRISLLRKLKGRPALAVAIMSALQHIEKAPPVGYVKGVADAFASLLIRCEFSNWDLGD